MAWVADGGAIVAQQALRLPPALSGLVRAYALRITPAGAPAPAPAAQRDRLRRAVHQAMRATLAEALTCDAERLEIRRTPGHAPVLCCDGAVLAAVHLSAAYADTGAVWAWSARYDVGVDVQAVSSDGTDADWRAVAQDFLGADAEDALLPMQGAALRTALAARWTQLEARLKCTGSALTEAENRPDGWDAGVHSVSLSLPDGWQSHTAALAWKTPCVDGENGLLH